jgi:hypothetical protein
MPDGAAVIRYDGKRGVVWRIKFTDAAGKQVMETLGPEREAGRRRKRRRSSASDSSASSGRTTADRDR